MRIGKIASGAEYRMDERFQNLLVFAIFQVSQTEKILKTCSFSKLKNSKKV